MKTTTPSMHHTYLDSFIFQNMDAATIEGCNGIVFNGLKVIVISLNIIFL